MDVGSFCPMALLPPAPAGDIAGFFLSASLPLPFIALLFNPLGGPDSAAPAAWSGSGGATIAPPMGRADIPANIQERMRSTGREAAAISAVRIDAQYEAAVVMAARRPPRQGGRHRHRQGGAHRQEIRGDTLLHRHPGRLLIRREAAHGDLGLLSQDDVMVVLRPAARAGSAGSSGWHRAHIIGITSHPDSNLLRRRGARDGVIEEPCPIGLTPSSMAVMLAISDAVALARCSNTRA